MKLFFILILSMSNLNISMKSEVVNNSNNLSTDYLKFNQDEDYILGEGDQIFIKLTDDIPEYSKRYSIDVNGTILLPLIKRIYISGLTLSELTKLLNEKYKEYVFILILKSQLLVIDQLISILKEKLIILDYIDCKELIILITKSQIKKKY